MKSDSIRYYAIIFSLFFLSGCWDLEEVDRRSFVTALGIDRNAKGKILMTAQIPIPQKMLPPGAGGESTQGTTFNTVTITGDTVNEVFRALDVKTVGTTAIEQNKLIVFGENTVKTDVPSIINFLVRRTKSPPQALVFIAKGKTAQEILQFQPKQLTLPGLMFSQSALSPTKYDRTFFIPIWEFYQRFVHTAYDSYAPLVDIDLKQGNYIKSGVAVFSKDRLAGKLNEAETQMFGLLTNRTSVGTLTFREGNNHKFTLRNVQPQTRIKVIMDGSRPTFQVEVRLKTVLSELTSDELTNSQNIRSLEKKAALQLKPWLEKVIRKLQQFNSDVIDFGEQFRVQHQAIWEKTHWKKVFPMVHFQVTVRVKISRDGVLR